MFGSSEKEKEEMRSKRLSNEEGRVEGALRGGREEGRACNRLRRGRGGAKLEFAEIGQKPAWEALLTVALVSFFWVIICLRLEGLS